MNILQSPYNKKRKKMKQEYNTKLVADTLAMITFSVVTGVIIEIGIVGLTWEQSLLSRLVAIPINASTGRPQGWWTDFLRKILKGQKGWRKWAVDMLGFVSFQTIVFCSNVTIGMLMTGSFSREILWKAGRVIIPILPFLGPVYGWWQDTVRKIIIH